MLLTPTEQERLTIFMAAELARRHRSIGNLLSEPEAIALICDEVMMAARQGKSVASLMEYGATILTSDEVLPGVATLIRLIQVEAMFPDGTKMVSIHDPIRPGRLTTLNHRIAGEILAADGEIELNQGRTRIELMVVNHGVRPVQIGSHYHFFEVNKELEFDRERSYGMRLDVPSGVSTRFEPGQEKLVTLVEFGGTGEIFGFNGLTNGSIHNPEIKARALKAARSQGYRGA